MSMIGYRTAVLAVSWLGGSAGHETGDYLVQLDCDAVVKQEHTPQGRRALARHGLGHVELRTMADDDPRGTAQHKVEALRGMDVSGHQGAVDWAKAYADGARFSYVKATEGTGFTSDTFRAQYDGAAAVGMLRGAYHFALPDQSTGAAQAHYFVDHGGGWGPDGRTLPGAVDLENNPYGEMCYGRNPQQLADWIADFSNTHRS